MADEVRVQSADVIAVIEEIVPGAGDFLKGGSVQLHDAVDSIAMLQVLLELERLFGTRLEPEAIRPGDFDYPDTLAAALNRAARGKKTTPSDPDRQA